MSIACRKQLFECVWDGRCVVLSQCNYQVVSVAINATMIEQTDSMKLDSIFLGWN
jgi:hypothetical protein